MIQTASLLGTHALGSEFESASRLSKRPGNVQSRVFYPSPRFLFSALWTLMPRKHSNGLITQSINQSDRYLVSMFRATICFLCRMLLSLRRYNTPSPYGSISRGGRCQDDSKMAAFSS